MVRKIYEFSFTLARKEVWFYEASFFFLMFLIVTDTSYPETLRSSLIGRKPSYFELETIFLLLRTD